MTSTVSLVVSLVALFGVLGSSNRQARAVMDAEAARHEHALVHSEQLALREARLASIDAIVAACVELHRRTTIALFYARPNGYGLTEEQSGEIRVAVVDARTALAIARFRAAVHVGEGFASISDDMDAASATSLDGAESSDRTAVREGRDIFEHKAQETLDRLVAAARDAITVPVPGSHS